MLRWTYLIHPNVSATFHFQLSYLANLGSISILTSSITLQKNPAYQVNPNYVPLDLNFDCISGRQYFNHILCLVLRVGKSALASIPLVGFARSLN